jgi:hypothetical protein
MGTKLFSLLTKFFLFDLAILKRLCKVKTYKVHLTVIFLLTLLDSTFFTIDDKVTVDIREMLREPGNENELMGIIN